MNLVRAVVLLTLAGAAPAAAQLAISQPTERLLLMPFPVVAPGDSAASIAMMDAARQRLGQIARYDVIVVPKDKICTALQASGYPCDALFDAQQVGQLASAMNVTSYNVGSFGRGGSGYAANVRIVSGGAGFSAAFHVNGPSPDAVADSLAERLHTLVRAGNDAHQCDDRRAHGDLNRALESARKALEKYPNLPAAELCIATVYELQGLGPDSIIAAAQRALVTDSMNTTALSRIARAYQQKGDTLRFLDYMVRVAHADPSNPQLWYGLANQMLLMHRYTEARDLLQDRLKAAPADDDARTILRRVCIEGQLWRCVLDIVAAETRQDTAKLADSLELKLAIGAAQALPDTQQLLRWTQAAVAHFPRSASFETTRGQAFEMAGQFDSAVAMYEAAATLSPADLRAHLLVATTIIGHWAYDTAHAPADTAALSAYKSAAADRLDAARRYLDPVLASSDSVLRLNATYQALQAGSKLAQNGIYDRAYPWLDQVVTLLTPRSPADTGGGRQALRGQAYFWYGLSSALSMGGPYNLMVKDKSCAEAKPLVERLGRARSALEQAKVLLPSVSATADNILKNVIAKYEAYTPKIREAFKCRNF